MQNIVTYKLKYTCKDTQTILNYIKNYNNVVKFTYNRLLDVYPNTLATKELTALQKQMNNVFVDSHFKNSAIYESKALITKNRNNSICFGGKHLYKQYTNNLISKEDLKLKRLLPICSIGEASHKGNRKFELKSNQLIIFKPNKNTHLELNLPKYKNYQKTLSKLIELQNDNKIPITYKLSLDYIYITFNLNKINNTNLIKTKENRVFAIDMNPNYIGYSIIDWKDDMKYKIVDKGVISIKELNDFDNSLKNKGYSSESKLRKYISNKRNFEVSEIGHKLVKIAKHYQCEIFSLEDLNIKSSDKGKGRNYNKLTNNQWCRGKLYQILKKLCLSTNIKFIEVYPQYSSFNGNIIYRQENLPDMVLASIEISRRGYELDCQYNKKTKPKKKNIVFPELHVVKDRVIHALEVLNYFEMFENLKDLFYSLKNSKLKYRVSLESTNFKVFRFNHKKSFINLYSFI